MRLGHAEDMLLNFSSSLNSSNSFSPWRFLFLLANPAR
jgi:hypothetical protein